MQGIIAEKSMDLEEQTIVAKKFRVQLDFEASDMDTINSLVKELKVGTRAELFRSSLRTLRWMVNKKKQKCDVVAISPEGKYFEPEFEFLAEV